MRLVLDERGVGTFFLVQDTVEGFGDVSRDGFAELGESGHELANHTKTHAGSSAGSPSEVTDCEAYLQSQFGVRSITFAYPNVDITSTYKDAATALYVASRGGGAGEHVTLEDEIDWHDVPSLTWRWSLPPRLAVEVRLRVLIDGGSLTQGGMPVAWDGQEGFYAVDPAAGELTWTQ